MKGENRYIDSIFSSYITITTTAPITVCLSPFASTQNYSFSLSLFRSSVLKNLFAAYTTHIMQPVSVIHGLRQEPKKWTPRVNSFWFLDIQILWFPSASLPSRLLLTNNIFYFCPAVAKAGKLPTVQPTNQTEKQTKGIKAKHFFECTTTRHKTAC